jgi:CheY-like chemotaxis protein
MASVVVPSILITDDDLAFRETVSGMLEPRGFRTLLASDGEEALRIMDREEIHLMLLDMHMPRLSGLETLRRVRQARLRLPCILLSAALDEAIIEQARMADAFSILSKPVSRLTITTTIDQALRRAYDWP